MLNGFWWQLYAALAMRFRAHPDIHPFIHAFTQSRIHSSIHSVMHSFNHSFNHAFIQSFIQLHIHSSIHSVTHSRNHSSSHAFNDWLLPSLHISMHVFHAPILSYVIHSIACCMGSIAAAVLLLLITIA